MNFAQQQAAPGRRFVGLGVVLLFHVLVVYLLITGLGKRVIDVIRAPIETKVIEEVKPPPPPEVVLPPPPKLDAPPPPFIPPPEIQISTPPPAPTITATTIAPPPAPMAVTPPPAAPAPPAPAAAPAPAQVGIVCPNAATVLGDSGFPPQARRAGIDSGTATLEWIVTPSGEIKDVKVVGSSNAIFARNSIRLVGDYKCQGQGHDVKVIQMFNYKME